jgi:hypothetical protein
MLIPAIEPKNPKIMSVGIIKYVFNARLLLLKHSIIKNCITVIVKAEIRPANNLFLLILLLAVKELINELMPDNAIIKRNRNSFFIATFVIIKADMHNKTIKVKIPAITLKIKITGGLCIFNLLLIFISDKKTPPYLLKDMKVFLLILLLLAEKYNYSSSLSAFFERLPLPFSAFSASFAAA